MGKITEYGQIQFSLFSCSPYFGVTEELSKAFTDATDIYSSTLESCLYMKSYPNGLYAWWIQGLWHVPQEKSIGEYFVRSVIHLFLEVDHFSSSTYYNED